jgi:SEC-C motif
MESDNYELFCNELNEVIRIFPNLSIKEDNNRKFIKGILDIYNDDSIIVGNYLIEVHFKTCFPFRFPSLFEIGGAIPNEADWHKYSDTSCCITVLPDEILKCKGKIGVVEFIKKYCCSFFANHIHRKRTGNYLNGYYSHGPQGYREFYNELLKTTDTSLWIQYLKHVFTSAIFSTDRNSECFCKSGTKFKHCHKLIFDSMWEIGRVQLYSDFKSILL